MYVMSNWEANIIRVLNYLKIKFEYEKKLITINNINYVPDIFLEDGTIIEIKGHWDNESLLKCYEYSQVNPNYYIIDSDFYYDIQKKYENLIEKWKHDKNILKAIKATVVGINFQGRKKYVENIKIGDKVFLKRDAENKFDKMAVKIEDVAGNQLGYLAKEWANIYARKLDIGMEFDSILREKNSNNLKIEIIRYNVDQEKMYKIFK